ncbi:hypothetical protein HDEF_0880 [Candidatus Hamiltonella defensa 5AT (Acyrthosiphon pisum)]|uniref:Uncharacterized protein n=1 Tax=Hamiltonella defensa subsp. Acyrthosiphon pisum (strain 5AT) TaxID=572265 RepID=C4K4V6_HAMD5|nr:hypothetical protein HDEF_0880 [Candidatus Hamiltonella defensa 5AT (Acyrthosiphon pisum)]
MWNKVNSFYHGLSSQKRAQQARMHTLLKQAHINAPF